MTASGAQGTSSEPALHISLRGAHTPSLETAPAFSASFRATRLPCYPQDWVGQDWALTVTAGASVTFETFPHPLIQCASGSWAPGGVSHTPPSSSPISKGCVPLGLCEDACWQRRQGNGSFHHPQPEHLLCILGKVCSILLVAAKSLQLCPTVCDPIDGGP